MERAHWYRCLEDLYEKLEATVKKRLRIKLGGVQTVDWVRGAGVAGGGVLSVLTAPAVGSGWDPGGCSHLTYMYFRALARTNHRAFTNPLRIRNVSVCAEQAVGSAELGAAQAQAAHPAQQPDMAHRLGGGDEAGDCE